MKLVPVVVCYFLPETGVKVKLLEFKSVSGQTAEILIENCFRFSTKQGSRKNLLDFVQTIATLALEELKEEDKIMFSLK